MFYIAADKNSPYTDKVLQDVRDYPGRIVAFGYDTKYVDPLVLDDIKSGRITAGAHAWIGTMTLGDHLEPVDLLREAIVQYIKIYANAYVRINLRLAQDKGKSQTYPARGKEQYLFSY